MGLGEILGESWKDYKENFRAIVKIMLIFSAIPAIIFFLIGIFWLSLAGGYDALEDIFNSKSYLNNGNVTKNVLAMDIEKVLSPVLSPGLSYNIFGIAASILVIFLAFFAEICILSTSLKKKKFSFSDLIEGGKKWYWAGLLFGIVSLIFLAGLFILLIIPGIIFMIYWIFGLYIYVDEKKGIIDSLKRSFHIVKRKWWKTLGYSLFFFLIIFLISLLFLIPEIITGIILFYQIFTGNFSSSFFIFSQILSYIFELARGFITIPLTILFFKNFYLEMKKR